MCGEGGAGLRPAARYVRLSCSVVVVLLLLAGTFFGDDDDFPFGPFRMYSTSTPPNGAVKVVYIEARDPAGAWRQTGLNPGNVGVNRAEIEGQIPRLVARPELLAALARSHARLKPRAWRWTGVRVVMRQLLLRDRRYVGWRDQVVAEWTEARP